MRNLQNINSNERDMIQRTAVSGIKCYNRIIADGDDMVDIRLRGLPFIATESDLTGLFKGYKIIP